MNTDLVTLLCDPMTHESLECRSGGSAGEFLVNPRSGRQFSLRDGIPVLFDQPDLSGSNARYQTLYNRTALLYDLSTWLYARWTGGSEEVRLREYLDELEIHDGDRVLEVSVGTGRNWHYLPRTAHYYGVDISWGMLQQCRRHIKSWRLDAALCMSLAEYLPFRDASFDVVFHVGGINYFNDPGKSITEMIRVARPGTKFIIVDETEELAAKYEKGPITGAFYGNRREAIHAPVDLVPSTMQDLRVKQIADGDLFCLSFRKP